MIFHLIIVYNLGEEPGGVSIFVDLQENGVILQSIIRQKVTNLQYKVKIWQKSTNLIRFQVWNSQPQKKQRGDID